MSLQVETNDEFFQKKWIAGFVVPIGLVAYGAYAALIGKVVLLQRYQPAFYTIEGRSASLIALGYIGGGLMLFGLLHAPLTDRLFRVGGLLVWMGAILILDAVWTLARYHSLF